MRILFISNAGSIHTVRWVNALSERGHEVHLVYKFDDQPKENRISKKVNQYRLKYSGNKGYLFNAIQLKKLSNSINPDIVNAHYASGYGTLVRLARLHPVVLSVWGSDVYDFPYQSEFKMKIVVDNLRYANVIASTSANMAEKVKVLLRDKTKKIYITPFGVDLSQFSINHGDTRYKNKIVIGNIKSLNEVYGIEFLIRAIKILKNKLESNNKSDISKKITAKIYGDGTLREDLELLVKKLGLEEIVIFKGEIPNAEVPSALEEFDIFCATSNQESFGVSIIEAMAMGLPVVATDVPGFKEVMVDGQTGIIVEKRNSEQIADAIEKMLFDEDLRLKYGSNGRQRVEDYYNFDKNVGEMIDIYSKVAEGKY